MWFRPEIIEIAHRLDNPRERRRNQYLGRIGEMSQVVEFVVAVHHGQFAIARKVRGQPGRDFVDTVQFAGPVRRQLRHPPVYLAGEKPFWA